MDLASILVPLLIVFIVVSLIMAIFAIAGVSPGRLLEIFMSARMYRTEQIPRDHYERWVYAKRRAGKPRSLRYAKTTGDKWVPPQYLGRVTSIEPWMSGYIIFIKTRAFGWSKAYFVDRSLCSDINRRVLWITCNGFAGTGPVRFPIPTEDHTDIDWWVNRHFELFRHSFEQLISSDILEDMAWSIANSMAPPLTDRAKLSEMERPEVIERENIPESQGGMV